MPTIKDTPPHGITDQSVLNRYDDTALIRYLNENGYRGMGISRGSGLNKQGRIQLYLRHQKLRESKVEITSRVLRDAVRETKDKYGSPARRKATPNIIDLESKKPVEKTVEKTVEKPKTPPPPTPEKQKKFTDAEQVEQDYYNELRNSTNPRVAELADGLSKGGSVEYAKIHLEKETGKASPESTSLDDIKITKSYVENVKNNDRVAIKGASAFRAKVADKKAEAKARAQEMASQATEAPEEVSITATEALESPAGNLVLEPRVRMAINEVLFRSTGSATQLAYNILTQAMWGMSNQQLTNIRFPLLEYLRKKYNFSVEQLNKVSDMVSRMTRKRANRSESTVSSKMSKFLEKWGTPPKRKLTDRPTFTRQKTPIEKLVEAIDERNPFDPDPIIDLPELPFHIDPLPGSPGDKFYSTTSELPEGWEGGSGIVGSRWHRKAKEVEQMMESKTATPEIESKESKTPLIDTRDKDMEFGDLFDDPESNEIRIGEVVESGPPPEGQVSRAQMMRMRFDQLLQQLRDTREAMSPEMTHTQRVEPYSTFDRVDMRNNPFFETAGNLLDSFFGVATLVGAGYGTYLLGTGQNQKFMDTFFYKAHNYFTSGEIGALQSSPDLFELDNLIAQINDDSITMGGWHQINRILRREYKNRDIKDPKLARMSRAQWVRLHDATDGWFNRNQDPNLEARIRQARLVGAPISNPVEFVVNETLHPRASLQNREQALTDPAFLKWVQTRSANDPNFNANDKNLVDQWLGKQLEDDVLMSKNFGQWLQEPEQKKITLGQYTKDALYKKFLDTVLTTDAYREFLQAESKVKPDQSVGWYRDEYLKSMVTTPQADSKDEVEAEEVIVEAQTTEFRAKRKFSELAGQGRGLKLSGMDTSLMSDAKSDRVPQPLRRMVQMIVVKGERRDLSALLDKHRAEQTRQPSRMTMLDKCQFLVDEYGVLLYLEKFDFKNLDTKELTVYYEVMCVCFESLMRQLGHRDDNGDSKTNTVIRNVLVDVSSLGLTLNDIQNGGLTIEGGRRQLADRTSEENHGSSYHRANTHITSVGGHSANDFRYHHRAPQVKHRLDTSYASYDLRYQPPPPRDLEIMENNLFFRSKRPKVKRTAKRQLKELLL